MTFVGHTESVTTVCVNGTTLASGSEDRTVRFWDIKVRNTFSWDFFQCMTCFSTGY